MRTYSVKAWLPAAVLLLSSVLNNCSLDENALPVFENQGTIGPEGGIVKAADGAYIEIPAGALMSEQTVSIANTTLSDVVANTGCKMYDFTPDGLAFADSVTIKLPFDDTYIDLGKEEENHGVQIMVFQDSLWKNLKTNVDLKDKIATAKTVHFSKYAVIFPFKWTAYFNKNKGTSSRILQVPYYYQGSTGWCTMYALSMVTRYHGYDFKAANFASLLDRDRSEGLKVYEEYFLDNVLEYLGVQAEVSVPWWSNMKELCGYLIYNLNNGKPIWLNSINHHHAVVICGFDQGGFYINDPSGAMVDDVYPEISFEELTMVHISYDDFLELMKTGFENSAVTLVLLSSEDNQERPLSLNFIPGSVQIEIKSPEYDGLGGLNFDGEDYKPDGYAIVNYLNSSNLLKGEYKFELFGVLANSNLENGITVNYRVLLDKQVVSGSSQLITVPKDTAFVLTERSTVKLTNLANGNHILRAEIALNESPDDVYEFWEFPFRIENELFLSGNCDDFSASQINSSTWTITSGSWNVLSGELHGYWSWSSAQTDQAIVMLSESLYDPACYTATTQIKVRTGSEICGERFVLRSSAGNQIMITFNWNLKLVESEYRKGGSLYSVVKKVSGFSAFNSTVGSVNEYKVEKNGSLIKVFVNGVEAIQFEDIYFNGNTKLGLAAYGNAYYDSFCIQ